MASDITSSTAKICEKKVFLYFWSKEEIWAFSVRSTLNTLPSSLLEHYRSWQQASPYQLGVKIYFYLTNWPQQIIISLWWEVRGERWETYWQSNVCWAPEEDVDSTWQTGLTVVLLQWERLGKPNHFYKIVASSLSQQRDMIFSFNSTVLSCMNAWIFHEYCVTPWPHISSKCWSECGSKMIFHVYHSASHYKQRWPISH